jgi:2'-5' RNA ligase
MSGMHFKKFGVGLEGIGTFTVKSPTVMFARISKGTEELIDIHDRMQEGLSVITRLDDKNFTPHVTIARLKRFDRSTVDEALGFANRYKNIELGGFMCNEIKLKQSVLTGSGAAHSDLLAIGLGD